MYKPPIHFLFLKPKGVVVDVINVREPLGHFLTKTHVV